MFYDLTDHQVGDEFEASPSELSRIISAILAESGTFTLTGKTLTITSLPNRKKVSDPPIDLANPDTLEPEPFPEPESVPEPEPVPEPTPEPEKPIYVPKPKTKPTGRPKKPSSPTIKEEDSK